ncbi:MAG: DASS family sodium-coupled anion symporter [Desulfitobacteriaceae bacterium]|nr:DASS family sodium-coupled anion symporter [Desulfitobacteriaceae bacterium]MDI6914291.1 DASS family sodium-coupled anion symporter [Desulfitobacteriaceae bacterium]
MSIPQRKNDEAGKRLWFTNNAFEAGLSPRTSIIGFILAWFIFFGIFQFVPISKAFSPAARAVLATTGWVIVIWITDGLPKSISGLMIPVLLVLTGSLPKPADAFNGFTSNEAFLCLGAFILAAVMQVTGVDKRIALTILSKVKPKIPNLLSGIFVAHVISALLVPATVARAGMYLPIVQGVNRLLGDTPEEKRARKALAMAGIGFGAVYAAPVFMTGHMPNVIMTNILNSKAHAGITWGGWLWIHWPMLGMFPMMWWWIVRSFKLKNVDVSGGTQKIKEEHQKLGPVSATEWTVLACFLIAVVLWATGSFHKINTGIVTLLAVGIVFIPGLLPLNWKNVQQKTIWGTWFLLAGALSLVTAFDKTGLDKFLATQMVNLVPAWGWFGILIFIMVMVQVLRLGIISNVGAVTLMAPIVFAMAPLLKMNSVAFTLAILNLDTYAMILPMEVTACLVAYGSEEFSFKEFMKTGTPLTLLAILYISIVMVPWWALIGYPIWKPF